MRRAEHEAEFPENYECMGNPNSIILMAWSLSRLHQCVDTSQEWKNNFSFHLLNGS